MLVVDEEEFIRQSQETLDEMWEWYQFTFRPRRDNSGDPVEADSCLLVPSERDTGHPVQS